MFEELKNLLAQLEENQGSGGPASEALCLALQEIDSIQTTFGVLSDRLKALEDRAEHCEDPTETSGSSSNRPARS